MSMLEVLQTFPFQNKSLLYSFGVVDPKDDQMIVFHVDKLENPMLPSSVVFQILVSIRNATIQRCIIDKGASTCMMDANVWKKIGCSYLSASTNTLWAWDGHPS